MNCHVLRRNDNYLVVRLECSRAEELMMPPPLPRRQPGTENPKFIMHQMCRAAVE